MLRANPCRASLDFHTLNFIQIESHSSDHSGASTSAFWCADITPSDSIGVGIRRGPKKGDTEKFSIGFKMKDDEYGLE